MKNQILGKLGYIHKLGPIHIPTLHPSSSYHFNNPLLQLILPIEFYANKQAPNVAKQNCNWFDKCSSKATASSN